MEVTLDQIKDLRERSGAGVMDCKRALEATKGNVGKAVEWLLEKNLASAEKKAGRVTAQGLIDSYIHAGRMGALVEVNCETDFVARTEEFKNLVHELAMQVAAARPIVVTEEELPEGTQRDATWEPVLLNQSYIRDPQKTIRQLITEAIGKTGENIQVKRFIRFELGE
ncbi:MAG TPA: translation elongation factor Ts [Dehalococcoidia bacterium]|nr:translation elongation factor Ts [Dehalococcoidia bacterium]